MHPVFSNRAAAGRLLAEKLASFAGRDELWVLALPRGGVPVAAEVAWAGLIVVAAPVAARESYLELRDGVRGFVVLTRPRDFISVGEYYEDFAQ